LSKKIAPAHTVATRARDLRVNEYTALTTALANLHAGIDAPIPPAESPPMTYTITVKPSQTPGKVTATSTNGHSLTTTTPLLDSARYWLNNNADPAAIIVTTWSSGPGHWSLRSTISNAASLTVMGDRFQKAKQSRIPAPPMR